MEKKTKRSALYLGVQTLAQIKQNSLNNRAHVDETKVTELVKRYGPLRLQLNVLIDRNKLVLGGYAAIIASERLGLERVNATIAVPELTVAEKQAYLIDDGYPEVALLIEPQYEVTISKEPRPRKRSPRRRPKKPIADSAANFEDPNASLTAWFERFRIDELIIPDGQHRASHLWLDEFITSDDDPEIGGTLH